MKVTFLLPRYGWRPSGGFSVVYTYAGLLSRRGHDVTVVHPRRLPRGGWPQPTTLHGRTRHAAGRLRDRLLHPSLAWARPDAAIRLSYVPEISEAHVPDGDVVIATWWSTAEAALALSGRKGERFHLIQGYETWNGAEDRVHAAWRAPLRKIIIARWLAERAHELGIAESLITVIPNAIDHDVFRVLEPLQSRPPRVAMLYSSESYKGGESGVEMLRRAKLLVPELTATLFGVGREPGGLPRWVHYIRNASAEQLARDVYNRSVVYLCPSLSEGWHLPPAEAMACGCALVSSDIGGVRDYARQDETALLFSPGDPVAGAEAVATLLRDAARRLAVAQRGRDVIREFTWERSGARLEALLEQSLRIRQRPPT